MKFSEKAMSRFKWQQDNPNGYRKVFTMDDLDDILDVWECLPLTNTQSVQEWWGLTLEQYATFVENPEVFLDYVNRHLNPYNIYSIEDWETLEKELSTVGVLTNLENIAISKEVKAAIKELGSRLKDTQRIFPLQLIIRKGVLEIL